MEAKSPALHPSDVTRVQLKNEIVRRKTRRRFFTIIRRILFTLAVVAAFAVLVAVLLLPVLRIYGHSMNQTLDEGDIVVSVKGGDFETGDIISFYYNNKLLVKRVIGTAGDWIDIDSSGNVYVNQVLLDEPYVTDKSLGDANITFPYQVPDSRVFVLGDNRPVSVDSRNTSIGCVYEEQIVGKIVFRVWPLSKFGPVS